ncbi:type IV toxin-antitoxin system AbiEi family antitoxin domain-containing protein [Telmatocola sphagniphila]|uniref:Type IV toxin-antitoxin system AbiEi family antitoxin domain-containing protein n=1 Tax=Telmatocola sphagniphila TaxID=1123043 RepID=A0A8E6B9G1_9BACT|nr:type IV toxin-antitoxin system AbiEi family antitoxin [Telmatocola sphagniphila]QVL33827.1 type IV toxin-antitoxin system AbiEi family antitoxin domain-containing protein [Telmatocola sphagniphila]
MREYIESQLARGRGYFTKEEALAELGLSAEAFQAAIGRVKRKGLLVSPRRGFYLILRPEDRQLGAPDPSRWIDPLMKHLGLDYRISLLRAAAFHGSSHQAAMIFQVIAPKQLPKIAVGRQRVDFLFQTSATFEEANNPAWLSKLKTEAGFAQIAGLELTLLDICRYFHKAAGINGAAQAVHDLGKNANPRILAKAASAYENSAVRRLGYFLERFGHNRQAESLKDFAKKAKSFKALDPAVKPLVAELGLLDEKNPDWMLIINVPVELEA